MKDWKNALALVALSVALAATGCSSKSPSVAGPSGSSSLTAPTIESPTDDQQLDTLRPTLTVRNGSGGDTRTYDFQLADNSNFSPITASKLSVLENSSGKTSVTIDTDLNPSTRYYWRTRIVSGGSASSWTIGKFKTKVGGYNRPGELFDVLSDGFTVGQRVGQTSFVPGRGIKIENKNSYVRYELPQTVSSGEFSMEVENLSPDGPTPKQAIFSMAQGLGGVNGSPYEMFAQYRGSPGNPDNCINFKAVMGGATLEGNASQRAASVVRLDPGTTYFWQGTWTPTSFRLVVRAGVGGSVVYDLALSGGGSYSPSPHVAYIGINSGDGSFPGMIVRNVWLSGNPRPASLGSAMGPR